MYYPIIQIPSLELAKYITLINWEKFQSIDVEKEIIFPYIQEDSSNYGMKHNYNSHLQQFTRQFNALTFWVICEVLKCQDIRYRVKTLIYAIKLAKKLYALNNLHALFAVLTGLQSAPIHRLKLTWQQVPKRYMNVVERLSELFSPTDNHANLRRHLERLSLPGIPYIGIFLTDLTYLQTCRQKLKQKELPDERYSFLHGSNGVFATTNYDIYQNNDHNIIYDTTSNFNYFTEPIYNNPYGNVDKNIDLDRCFRPTPYKKNVSFNINNHSNEPRGHKNIIKLKNDKNGINGTGNVDQRISYIRQILHGYQASNYDFLNHSNTNNAIIYPKNVAMNGQNGGQQFLGTLNPRLRSLMPKVTHNNINSSHNHQTMLHVKLNGNLRKAIRLKPEYQRYAYQIMFGIERPYDTFIIVNTNNHDNRNSCKNDKCVTQHNSCNNRINPPPLNLRTIETELYNQSLRLEPLPAVRQNRRVSQNHEEMNNIASDINTLVHSHDSMVKLNEPQHTNKPNHIPYNNNNISNRQSSTCSNLWQNNLFFQQLNIFLKQLMRRIDLLDFSTADGREHQAQGDTYNPNLISSNSDNHDNNDNYDNDSNNAERSANKNDETLTKEANRFNITSTSNDGDDLTGFNSRTHLILDSSDLKSHNKKDVTSQRYKPQEAKSSFGPSINFLGGNEGDEDEISNKLFLLPKNGLLTNVIPSCHNNRSDENSNGAYISKSPYYKLEESMSPSWEDETNNNAAGENYTYEPSILMNGKLFVKSFNLQTNQTTPHWFPCEGELTTHELLLYCIVHPLSNGESQLNSVDTNSLFVRANIPPIFDLNQFTFLSNLRSPGHFLAQILTKSTPIDTEYRKAIALIFAEMPLTNTFVLAQHKTLNHTTLFYLFYIPDIVQCNAWKAVLTDVYNKNDEFTHN